MRWIRSRRSAPPHFALTRKYNHRCGPASLLAVDDAHATLMAAWSGRPDARGWLVASTCGCHARRPPRLAARHAKATGLAPALPVVRVGEDRGRGRSIHVGASGEKGKAGDIVNAAGAGRLAHVRCAQARRRRGGRLPSTGRRMAAGSTSLSPPPPPAARCSSRSTGAREQVRQRKLAARDPSEPVSFVSTSSIQHPTSLIHQDPGQAHPILRQFSP
ncbi:unnamed protein product [Urochloa humidicola]